jgi:hypothetical protein
MESSKGKRDRRPNDPTNNALQPTLPKEVNLLGSVVP